MIIALKLKTRALELCRLSRLLQPLMQRIASQSWRTVLRAGRIADCHRGVTTSSEQRLVETITSRLSHPTSVKVVDTSGGCGTMFTIEVIAGDFKYAILNSATTIKFKHFSSLRQRGAFDL